MASRIRYIVPYSDAAYEKTSVKVPMTNHSGLSVYAVGPYVNPDTLHKDEPRVLQQDFTEMDVVKILMQTLGMEMHIENLQAQGFIRAMFPLSNLGKMKELDDKWIRRLALKPSPANLARCYFGEEIGYFFKFLGYMAKELLPLALVGLLFFVVANAGSLSLAREHELRLLFCLFMVMWTAVFMSRMKQELVRCQQCWGMSEYQEFTDFSRAEFKPELEGTVRLKLQKGFVKAVEALYPAAFAGAIYALEATTARAKEAEDSGLNHVLVQYSSILLTVTIQVFSIAWSLIAPKLASMENPRFNSRWEDILAGKLFFVTCFVALWNFIYLAFIKKYMPEVCVDTLAEAARAAWQAADASKAQMTYLEDSHTWRNSEDLVCLSSCFPLSPGESYREGRINCMEELESTLTTYFLFQLIAVIVSVAQPIVMVKLEVQRDIKAAKEKGYATNEYDDLQVQGKCAEVAKYGYGLGGGSKNEDFMMVVVSYGLLVTFGVVRPLLAPMAMCAFYVLYKLLAYRMVHVTSRPEPRSSRGVDNWIGMFESLSKFGILTNTALAVFDLMPMRHWPMKQKMVAFVCMEHVLLTLYSLAGHYISLA